jgi:hypothetical protein
MLLFFNVEGVGTLTAGLAAPAAPVETVGCVVSVGAALAAGVVVERPPIHRV